MRCPFCQNEESKVTDSRSLENAIRRRRECLKCEQRFTTFETLDLTVQVFKRDGTYEDFNIEKLLKGLDAACYHTKVSHDQVRAIAEDITAEIMKGQIRQISSKELGERVMDKLKEVDELAYIRFACVYKRFQSIEDVVGAIKSFSTKPVKEN